MIWLGYMFLTLGYSLTHGFYSLWAAGFISIALTLLVLYIIKKPQIHNELLIKKSVLVGIYSMSFMMYGGLYQTNGILKNTSFLLLFLMLVILCISLLKKSFSYKKILIFFFISHILLRVFMLISSPNPHIDVFDYVKYGALAILDGKNPYSVTYHQMYPNVSADFYSYLPMTILTTTPFVLFFGDPRYAIIFSEVAASLILLKMCSGKDKYLYPLLLLGNPMSLYVLEQSYIEPILIFGIVGFIYLMRKKKYWSGAIISGMLLATKQYMIFFPLFFLNSVHGFKTRIQYVAITGITTVCICLPFFLWNQKDFLHDAVFLQYVFSPRYEGLTFFSFLYWLFGTSFSFWISTGLIFIGGIGLFVIKRNSTLDYLMKFSCFLLIFFFFNKWAFVNYYYLVGQLLVVFLAAENSRYHAL